MNSMTFQSSKTYFILLMLSICDTSLPPTVMEWGLWHIILKAAKIGKEVNVEPSIGKSRKHPWLSQKVLAFRLLN